MQCHELCKMVELSEPGGTHKVKKEIRRTHPSQRIFECTYFKKRTAEAAACDGTQRGKLQSGEHIFTGVRRAEANSYTRRLRFHLIIRNSIRKNEIRDFRIQY
mgnify:FL=1